MTTPGRQRRRLTATETDLDVRRQLAFLVSVYQSSDARDAEVALDELSLLVETAGSDPIDEAVLRRPRLDPATFIGNGQATELAHRTRALDVDVVVFDNSLTPTQQRNLQKIFHCDVVDRTAVILDIFAQHATSAAGMLQVELAQLRYLAPRLRGKGTELSRLAGGIGTRGPGESKLETDRRRIAGRITKLEKELTHISRIRATQAKSRERSGQFRMALVGYTNAGKSTLLNALTDADALTEDQLFSTLDATVRRMEMPGRDWLVSDTVGFVRSLPHELVEAFRSTLYEVSGADLLLHVVDGSDPEPERQIAAVREVLSQIDAHEIPQVLAVNKTDRADPNTIRRLLASHRPSIALSATVGTGIDKLKSLLVEVARSHARVVELRIPYDHSRIVSELHELGEVIEQTHEERFTRMRVRLSPAVADRFTDYQL